MKLVPMKRVTRRSPGRGREGTRHGLGRSCDQAGEGAGNIGHIGKDHNAAVCLRGVPSRSRLTAPARMANSRSARPGEREGKSLACGSPSMAALRPLAMGAHYSLRGRATATLAWRGHQTPRDALKRQNSRDTTLGPVDCRRCCACNRWFKSHSRRSPNWGMLCSMSRTNPDIDDKACAEVNVPSTTVELNAGEMLRQEKRFRGLIGGSCSSGRDFPILKF